MPFDVSWTEPNGDRKERFDSPKDAMLRYVEVLGQGYAHTEIRDKSGAQLTPDDMVQLIALETRNWLNASRS